MPPRQHKNDLPDLNQEAARVVREITESEPYNAEEDLGSEDLARQLREAKERERLRAEKLGK